MLSFAQARHVVEEHASCLRPQGQERLGLVDSIGRVLAEPLVADRNFPPFARATRDGYAVRARDLSRLPANLAVVGEIKAGAEVPLHLGPGQAAAIMTGAPAPSGADSVVMVEYTSRMGDRVEVSRGIAVGENIVPRGAEAKQGEQLLAPGILLDAAAIALASSVGKSHLLVYAKPRVAVLATGDELVDVDVAPAPPQIRNSNSYSLAAQIRAAGGEPELLPIAPDEPRRLRELIGDGLNANLLLLSGGVSAGRYDLVEQVLGELKAEFFFTGVEIQPGRPMVFGRLPRTATEPSRGPSSDGRYFFGLPGNPVSTMVTFELFTKPVVRALAGMALDKLVFLRARLKSEVRTKTGLQRFLPALLSGEFDQAEVELLPWHGSGDMAATARANCYLVITPAQERIAAGEWVPVLLR
jgi:molybdopterin molybdotransferase